MGLVKDPYRSYNYFVFNSDIILVDKPAGVTSFGVVARVRRLLSEQAGHKVKVGHTGTLDPFATGLMILVSGQATKRAGEFSKLDKIYDTTVELGAHSSTGDPEGEITPMSAQPIPTRRQIEQVLRQFIGEITQTPPIFSAIKVGGVRAYKLARLNKVVEIPPRKVIVYSLQLLSYEYPYLTLRAHVSSGTYIRTLAMDIGKALETGAYCKSLRRTAVGKWTVEQATDMLTFETQKRRQRDPAAE